MARTGLPLFAFLFGLVACDGAGTAASINEVSHLAKTCHNILYADALVSTGIANNAASSSSIQLYDFLDQSAKVLDDLSATVPATTGYERTQAACEEYARGVAESLHKAAAAIDDPSPSKGAAMMHSFLAPSAVGQLTQAMESDLAHSDFPRATKMKLLNRLLHG